MLCYIRYCRLLQNRRSWQRRAVRPHVPATPFDIGHQQATPSRPAWQPTWTDHLTLGWGLLPSSVKGDTQESLVSGDQACVSSSRLVEMWQYDLTLATRPTLQLTTNMQSARQQSCFVSHHGCVSAWGSSVGKYVGRGSSPGMACGSQARERALRIMI